MLLASETSIQLTNALEKLIDSGIQLGERVLGALIIFSSLVNEEMRKKGEQLGADAQLTKPEIGMLVEAIDNLIDKSVD